MMHFEVQNSLGSWNRALHTEVDKRLRRVLCLLAKPLLAKLLFTKLLSIKSLLAKLLPIEVQPTNKFHGFVGSIFYLLR